MKRILFVILIIATFNNCSSGVFSFRSKLDYDFIGIEQEYTYVHFYSKETNYNELQIKEKSRETLTLDLPINTNNTTMLYDLFLVHWNMLVVKQFTIKVPNRKIEKTLS